MKQNSKIAKGWVAIVTKCSVFSFPQKNTALHFAAREGHAKAVALLLSYDANIILNKKRASFLHVAIHNKRKEVVLTTIRNKRYVASPPTIVWCPLASEVIQTQKEAEREKE